MNYIDTSQIVDPNVQQPFLGQDVDFLYNVSHENIQGLVYNIVGENLFAYSNSNGVVVSGCQTTGGGNTIFSGWVYFKGEYYFFPGATGLNGYTNPPAFVLDRYNDTSIDPVLFSDNVSYNVHKINRVKIADTTSSVLWLVSDTGRIVKPTQVTGTTTGTAGAGITNVTGASFVSPARICNLKITIGITAYYTDTANATQGLELYLMNITDNVALKVKTSNFKINSGGTGYAAGSAMSITYVYNNAPASKTIGVAIQRTNSVDVQAQDIDVTYEEVI